jgi:hypothetical protein
MGLMTEQHRHLRIRLLVNLKCIAFEHETNINLSKPDFPMNQGREVGSLTAVANAVETWMVNNANAFSPNAFEYEQGVLSVITKRVRSHMGEILNPSCATGS